MVNFTPVTTMATAGMSIGHDINMRPMNIEVSSLFFFGNNFSSKIYNFSGIKIKSTKL